MTVFTTWTSQISNHFGKLTGWSTPAEMLAEETTNKTEQATRAAFENLNSQDVVASTFGRLASKDTFLVGSGFAVLSFIVYKLFSQGDSEAIREKKEWKEWNTVSRMMCNLWSMKRSNGSFSKDQDHQEAEKTYNKCAGSIHNLVKIMVDLLRELKQQQLTGSNLDDQAAEKLFKEVHRQLEVLKKQLDKAPCETLSEERVGSMKWVVLHKRHQALGKRLNQLKEVASYVKTQWRNCKNGQRLSPIQADSLIPLSESPLTLRITNGTQELCKLESQHSVRHCYKYITDIIEYEMDTLLLLFHLGTPALNAWRNFGDLSSEAIKTIYQDVQSASKGKKKRTSGRQIEREESKSRIEPNWVEVIGRKTQDMLKMHYDVFVKMESRRKFEATAIRTKPTNHDERLTQINEAFSTEKGFSLRLKILKMRLEKVQGHIQDNVEFQGKLQKWCKENKVDRAQLIGDLDTALKLINMFTVVQSQFMKQLEEASKSGDKAVEKYCQCMRTLAAPYCNALVPLIAMQKQRKLDLLANVFSGDNAIGGVDTSTIKFQDYPQLDGLIKQEQETLEMNLKVAQTKQKTVKTSEQGKWGKIVGQLKFEAIPALKNLADKGGFSPLTDFTILPVQRWPRVGLYLKEVIKATNKDSVEEIELLRTASLAVDIGGFRVNLS